MLGSFPSRSWLGWLFWASLCAAQTPASPGPGQTSLAEILQLAKAHRYAEAASAIRRVPEPKVLQQQIAFLRLRASIESGLGDSKAAATDMEAAAKLAPNNSQLQAAAALARLEANVTAHLDPAPSLRTLRSIDLPPAARLELHLRSAEVLSRAHLYKEAV